MTQRKNFIHRIKEPNEAIQYPKRAISDEGMKWFCNEMTALSADGGNGVL